MIRSIHARNRRRDDGDAHTRQDEEVTGKLASFRGGNARALSNLLQPRSVVIVIRFGVGWLHWSIIRRHWESLPRLMCRSPESFHTAAAATLPRARALACLGARRSIK